MSSKQDCIRFLTDNNPGMDPKVVESIVDDLLERKTRMAAEGKMTRGAADLAEAVNRDYDAARTALAAKRRQVAISILRRRDFDDYAAQVRSEGFSTLDALEARLVGHARSFTGARQSVDARRTAIMNEWVGSLTLEIDAMAERNGMTRGELLNMVGRDRQFLEECASERMAPGSTKSPLARECAALYGRLFEAMRQRLNKAGAAIAHLEGRVPQSHDADKLLSKRLGGKEGWLSFIFGLIDSERSFPGRTGDEIRGILSDMYDGIATGKDLKTGDSASFLTPRHIASGLDRHRVIHFKDAASFLQYQDRYGRGNLIDAIFGEMDRNSRTAGLMEIFGPNPEHMIRSIMEADAQRIQDEVAAGRMDADAGQKQIQALHKAWSKEIKTSGRIARWLAVLTGETMRADSVGLAKAFGIARSMQILSKLGRATSSAMSDGLIKSMSMRVNGANFLERTFQPFADSLQSYKGDKRRLAYEWGFLLDAMQGSAAQRFDMTDGTPGKMAALVHGCFKWSGLNFVTEQSKAGYAMWLSRYLGRQNRKSFDALSPEIKALLDYHGFGADEWEVFRKGMVEGGGENRYFNPALARELDDAQMARLLPERLRQAAPEVRARVLDRIRTDLETRARAFLIDDAKFAVIEPDAKITAIMTPGSRRGAREGELLRSVMQCKSVSVAFMQSILGGRRWRRGWMTGFDKAGMADYIVASLACGYIAMTLKDLSRNRTPKDPREPGTWFTASVRSGGAGVYGDFFLSKMKRFGDDVLATMAGPLLQEGVGTVATVSLALHGGGEAVLDKAMRMAMDNAPFINLWYTRAALDWAILDGVKEWMSPGYTRRMLRNMWHKFGQRLIVR